MSWRAGLARIATGVAVLTLIATVATNTTPMASAANIITQGPDSSGSIDVAGSAGFVDTLTAASGSDGGTVTFIPSSLTSPGLTVVGADGIATTGVLPAATYTIAGNDSDGSGDSGTWSYSLVVSPDTITQTSSSPGSTDVAASSTFQTTLSAASGFVGQVTFTTSTTGFEITNSDVLSTTGTLSATGSPYTITGSDTDAYGDAGVWSYTLDASPDTILQGSPTSGTTNTSASGAFSTILTATTGVAPITFATSTAGFTVVSGNELKTTAPLSASTTPYTVTGTDTDAFGDSGAWSYALTVVSSGGVSLIQTSSTTATIKTTSSATFTAGPITVENNDGVVTFVTTKSNADIEVSSTGLISTTGALSAGAYSVSGTDSDAFDHSGSWTFTLTVTAPAVSVTFNANGGSGQMSPETANAPTALSLNRFVWAAHTFVDWNTSANGSGTSYANGALFPFGVATQLFAQWKKGKVPSHTITFAANGGAGNTASEVHNTPTAISPNHFTRKGYSFLNWNTKANGSGQSYGAGATYPFTTSATLYAQWAKNAKPPTPKVQVVTFNANGGKGAMGSEGHPKLAPLTPNRYTRAGYTFLHWNTKANGSGITYANDAPYSFGASITLYAQWKKNKTVVPPPAVPSGTQIGPFAVNSSTLSPALEAQIESLAVAAKTNKSTAISLLGYGDALSAADASNPTFESANIALSRERAQAVATYLGGRLTALGLNGWAISIAAAPNGRSGSGQGASSIVIAALS